MSNKQDNYIIDSIKIFLFASFSFFLPVSQKLSTINIGLLLIISLFGFKRNEFYLKKGLVISICLYVLYCISLLYSTELQINIIEQKASLLVFPVIFMLNKDYSKYFNLILKYFVIGCLVALAICEFNAFYNSLDINNLAFVSRVNKSMGLYDSIQKEENYFFSYHFSCIHQAVYFSMYLLFAIIAILYKNMFQNEKIRYGLLIFFTLGIFQILNKASLIILFIIIILKVYIAIKNKKIAYISIIFLLITAVSIFILNPRFKNFYERNFDIDNSKTKVKDFRKIDNTNPNSNHNFRVMLWCSAIELIKENPIFGIGAGGSDNRLYEVFAVKRQWYWKKEKYHAHNQYLQIMMDLGVIGFSVFIFFLIYFINRVYKCNDKNLSLIAINFMVVIMINFLFESMFERYSGISFFCFFYCLLICVSKEKIIPI